MRSMVTVAGTALPEPSTYSATTSTVVDSGRNVKGYVIASVIRSGIAKVELSWNFISAQDWANVMSLFNKSFFNSVTFFCQDSNKWEPRTMYVGDRTASVFLRNPDGSIKGYTGAKLSLIEV